MEKETITNISFDPHIILSSSCNDQDTDKGNNVTHNNACQLVFATDLICKKWTFFLIYNHKNLKLKKKHIDIVLHSSLISPTYMTNN